VSNPIEGSRRKRLPVRVTIVVRALPLRLPPKRDCWKRDDSPPRNELTRDYGQIPGWCAQCRTTGRRDHARSSMRGPRKAMTSWCVVQHDEGGVICLARARSRGSVRLKEARARSVRAKHAAFLNCATWRDVGHIGVLVSPRGPGKHSSTSATKPRFLRAFVTSCPESGAPDEVGEQRNCRSVSPR